MTFEVPALAAGFASKFDEIGPYIGFGSLVAVVAMAILVFAQGRELQRLRDWAGSSPERLDALEREVRDGAASRLVQPVPRAVPGAPGAGFPGAPPRPPGAPGVAAPGVPGSPVVGAGAATPPGVPGVARPTPPRPTPPGSPGATRVLSASSAAGGPRASTPAGAAATARERERASGPDRSIGQIIGVAVVGVIVLVALLFAFGVFGGGSDGPKDNTAKTTPGGSNTPTTPKRAPSVGYPPTEMTTLVLNASGSGGLAGDVSDLIDQSLRLQMSKATNYTVNGAPAYEDVTTVQYRSDSSSTSNTRQNRLAAQAVQKLLRKTVPGARLARMTDDVAANAGSSRLVVLVGKDYAAKKGSSSTSGSGASTGTGGTSSTGGASSTGGSTSTTTPQSTTGGQLTPQTDDLGDGTTDGTGGTAVP